VVWYVPVSLPRSIGFFIPCLPSLELRSTVKEAQTLVQVSDAREVVQHGLEYVEVEGNIPAYQRRVCVEHSYCVTELA
jgi:hypothetical protein